MDMGQSYISVTQDKLPEAETVSDRFHVAKHIREAVYRVRRTSTARSQQLATRD